MGCGITCLLNVIAGHYFAEWMCTVQQFYVTFGIGANAWLNFVIAWQIYRMLDCKGKPPRAPTRTHVLRVSLSVYAYVFLLACMGFIQADGFPFTVGTFSGLACTPLETDRTSSFFMYLIFMPLFVLLPLAGVFWISFQVYYRKMLPPDNGRRRHTSIYFLRLMVVFMVLFSSA